MQQAETSNLADVLETGEIEIIERAEARNSGVPLFCAHWHIFIPTAVIAFLYASAWLVLAWLGRTDSAMARLFIVVMAIGVPLLTVHAFLRFQTIRVQIGQNEILCHTGWPKELPVRIPANVISKARVSRGLAGRLFGGGTVFINLTTGGRIAIQDLAEPENACAEIEALRKNWSRSAKTG